VGQAEGQERAKEGSARAEARLWAQTDESCDAEEAIGDDEGAVGSEEEGIKTELGIMLL
jgi:hypothetical protein